MTTRYLNRSRNKLLLDEYTRDLADGFPHPITYVLFDRKLNIDIHYKIKEPVDISVLKVALVNYTRVRGENPDYNDDVLTCEGGAELRPPSDD
jgi:hypothetical protein